jgi:hypothetical protein
MRPKIAMMIVMRATTERLARLSLARRCTMIPFEDVIT